LDTITQDRLIQELRTQTGNMLSAVQLLTPLIEEKGESADLQCLAMLQKSFHQMVRTIRHLELDRAEDPLCHPAVLDVSGLCLELGREVESALRCGRFHFQFTLECETLITVADAFLLKTAILDLIANALDAAGPEGQVTMRLRRSRGLAQIIVGDNGPGLAPENLDPLLKRPGDLALGLMAAQRFAALHGGSLIRENRTEGGVRAILSFPVRHPSDPGVTTSPATGYDPTGGFSPVLVELSPVLPSQAYTFSDLND